MPVIPSSWQEVWREVATKLPTKGLEKLLVALDTDDPRLAQMVSVLPYTYGLLFSEDEEVTAACPIGFCGWQSEELGDSPANRAVEGFVIKVLTGVRGICTLLDFIDRTDRTFMRTDLAKEVRLELVNRGVSQ